MSEKHDYASGYARSHRVYELAGIFLGSACAIRLGYGLVSTGAVSGWWVPLTVFAGLLGADFVSGVVHWLFDTWGSVDTPVVGQLAIRTFREHHVDARAMTRHDFVETNGHNITLSMLPSITGLLALQHHSLAGTLVAMSGFFMALCVSMTSQIHKWAHKADGVPRVVRKMQDLGLIIGARHHDRHHVKPHDSHYCITVGWMNGPLEFVHFFRILERAITAVTGVQPREEDIVATADVPATPVVDGEPDVAPREALPSEVAAPVDAG
jgi:ubiquitin-conjugating enzyme E2 variant